MILLVEDDPASGRAMALALRTAGHEVVNATNGDEALQLLPLHDVQLVVTDLKMPVVNGFDLIQTIRLKRPKMPILIVSGSLPRMQEKLFFDDPAAFLQKPVSPTVLITAVERLLSKS